MNTGIGAPGPDHAGGMAGQPGDRCLQQCLHRQPVVLALPAHQTAAVIFDGQPVTRHDVPAGSG